MTTFLAGRVHESYHITTDFQSFRTVSSNSSLRIQNG